MERKARHSQPNIYVDTPMGSPWRKRLSSTLKTAFGSPHFHRKKIEPPSPELENGITSPDPEPVKRSWFANFMAGSGEKTEVILVISDKTESELVASLERGFRAVGYESREVEAHTYKLKYESKGKSLVKKTVKFTLHFEATEKGAEDGPKRSSSAGVGATTHTLTFTLISGSASKFKKLTDRLQVAMLSPYDSGHDSPETPSIASEELLQVIKSDSHSPVACRRKGGSSSTGSGNTPTKNRHEYTNMLDSSDDPDSDEGILDLPKK